VYAVLEELLEPEAHREIERMVRGAQRLSIPFAESFAGAVSRIIIMATRPTDLHRPHPFGTPMGAETDIGK
jgi:hypothetical protein